MKYFRVVETNKFLFDGSLISEKGVSFVNGLLKAEGHACVVVEEVSQDEIDQIQDLSYYYVPLNEIGRPYDNCGENNLYIDLSGNEYHN